MPNFASEKSTPEEDLSAFTDIYHALSTFFMHWSKLDHSHHASKWMNDTCFQVKISPSDFHNDINTPDWILNQIFTQLNRRWEDYFLWALWWILDEWLENWTLSPKMSSILLRFCFDKQYFALWDIIAKRFAEVNNPDVKHVLVHEWIYFLVKNPNPSRRLLSAFLKTDNNTQILPDLIVTMIRIYGNKTNAILSNNPNLRGKLRRQLETTMKDPTRLQLFLDDMRNSGGIPTQVQKIIDGVIQLQEIKDKV
jgi:hypothetical protein